MSNIPLHDTMTNTEAQQVVKIYKRAAMTAQHFSIGESTLWYWVKTRPGFPKPIKAGMRTTLFDVHAIDAFLRRES